MGGLRRGVRRIGRRVQLVGDEVPLKTKNRGDKTTGFCKSRGTPGEIDSRPRQPL